MPGMLNHSPADVTRWLMIELGLGTDPTLSPQQAWPISVATEPDAPDNCLTCTDTAGVDDGRNMPGGERQIHDGVQVRLRSVDFPTGAAKVRAILNTLDTQAAGRSVTIGISSYLVWNVSTSPPIYVGRDRPTTNRVIHTLNLKVSVRETV